LRRDDIERLLRAGARGAWHDPAKNSPQVGRPRVADPERLDVVHPPAARREPRHLLLGFRVVVAEREIRVEEDFARQQSVSRNARRPARKPAQLPSARLYATLARSQERRLTALASMRKSPNTCIRNSRHA